MLAYFPTGLYSKGRAVIFLEANNLAYQTAQETAEAWGVTKRYVNLCIECGRVPGALKVGKIWLVPKGTEKPSGQSHLAPPPPYSLADDVAYMVKAIHTPAPHDAPDSIVQTAGEERLRRIHEGALAYARGDFEQVKRRYLQHRGDDAARLCASAIAIAAAMSTGDYGLFLEIEAFLKDAARADSGPEVTAFAELALATAHLSAMAPDMIPGWLKEGDFTALPPQARPDAAYKRAKYFQCLGQFEPMLTVAQTALSLGDSRLGLSFSDTYLRLMCGVACFALGRAEEARRWLLDAMRRNLPHGYITPFAEVIPLFGGMVEQCLKQEFPERYDAVIGQWKRTFANWLTFHNRFTKDNITLILTLREYEMALMVARRVPYEKVAEQFHLTRGSLKNAMQIVYGKLCVNNRAELSKLIL